MSDDDKMTAAAGVANESDDAVSAVSITTTALIAGNAAGAATASGATLAATAGVMRSMKSVGFAVYDAPPALRQFLQARASGTASRELLTELSEKALAEQEENLSRMPKADLIDFEAARRERETK